jgi:hypothetical protein
MIKRGFLPKAGASHARTTPATVPMSLIRIVREPRTAGAANSSSRLDAPRSSQKCVRTWNSS